ncbi:MULTISPECIES: DUF3306 domain-containing protein [unclassified Photobacterium]|uniref:DUF3306 domain-containing protein n=1 Tax=unclassified Photobacterium TaxID=2628852 RepID=UPI001EDFA7A1|nr:DUF3306 domain-containing protein [Photobacterium sp. Ph6]MCG3875192.1 DUF3306 domain-containing protein [Photobacterium sp. Ph5]
MATNFFQRWSQRKLTKTEDKSAGEELTLESAETALEQDVVVTENTAINTDVVELIETDKAPDNQLDNTDLVAGDIPDIALTHDDVSTVTYDSGVASFMKESVEKSVKKAALRKLFHSEEFNYISDMDDCTEDFSNIPTLDPAIASQMRGWMDKAVEKVTDIVEDLGSEVTPDSEVTKKAEIAELSESTTERVEAESVAPQYTHYSALSNENNAVEETIPTSISLENKTAQDS